MVKRLISQTAAIAPDCIICESTSSKHFWNIVSVVIIDISLSMKHYNINYRIQRKESRTHRVHRVTYIYGLNAF